MRLISSLCLASTLSLAPACGGNRAPDGAPIEVGVDATTAAPDEANAAKVEPTPTATPTPENNAEPTKVATPEPVPEAPAEVAAVEPVPVDPKPAVVAADEGPAKALVEQWLKAQNDGDFAAYSALFDGRFTGVKRAGERTRRFDRARWLTDRQRMFQKKMTVTATDMRVMAGHGSDVVTFTQTWESGSYRDVGPKQLVLVGEGAAMRIAREEMLASQVEGVTANAPVLAPTQYLPVVTAPGFMGLVIGDVGELGGRKLGPAMSLFRGRSAFAAEAVPMTDAPKVTLFGVNGVVCEITPTARGVFADIQHHFGQIQVWDGTSDDGGPRVDDAEVAAQLVAHGDGTWEVWRIDAERCKGALWGRLNDKDESPAVLTPIEAPELADKATAAFRALPFSKAIQKDFEADETVENAKGQRWDTWDADISTRVFSAADGTRYVARSVASGTGCGTFGASGWALWRVSGDVWTLLSDADAPGDAFTPLTGVDLDGDGQPEFTDGTTLVQPVGTVWRPTRNVTSPSYDCPC